MSKALMQITMSNFRMRLLTFLLTFGFLTSLYGQAYPALDAVLKKELPENSREDGRWVYYPDKANITKLEKPLVKAVLRDYDIYEVSLTHFLGYHINQGTCVVLFDSLDSEIVLVEPVWYGGISEPLVKLFIGKRFRTQEKFLSFLKELNELMEVGSGFRFVNTSVTDTLVTYDLVSFKGDSYTTGGNGTSSTVNYPQDEVWRQIEIKIEQLVMVEYISINPKLKDKEGYEDSYKQTIR